MAKRRWGAIELVLDLLRRAPCGLRSSNPYSCKSRACGSEENPFAINQRIAPSYGLVSSEGSSLKEGGKKGVSKKESEPKLDALHRARGRSNRSCASPAHASEDAMGLGIGDADDSQTFFGDEDHGYIDSSTRDRYRSIQRYWP